MNYSKEAQDLDFAYKVRHALNESAENLPDATLDRLANARKIAMSRKKAESATAVFALGGVLAGNNGHAFQGPLSWWGKLGLTLPVFVLIVGLMGIYEYEQQLSVSELAEIDTAVLVDELPPDAYLDDGFRAFLDRAED